MGDTTIEWTDKVWNPVTGCTKVSQGCKHCYAERVFPRAYSRPDKSGAFRKFTDVRCHPERLDQPLRWRKPCRIFVNSMSDLFHEDIPQTFIAKVFEVMNEAHQHTFQVLTKRPERMLKILSDRVWPWATTIDKQPQPNVWLGVSVEDQATADERIPLLLETPAAVRFVSFEPALGPVDFRRLFNSQLISWLIVGGESGPKARPFNLEWARDTIAQCKAAGIACFVKQLGSNPVSAAGFRFEWIKDRAGADPSEWPEDLRRVREFPE